MNRVRLLRLGDARVKIKKQMATIRTFEAVAKQSIAMGAKDFEIGLFDPNAAQGAMLIACVGSRYVASLGLGYA